MSKTARLKDLPDRPLLDLEEADRALAELCQVEAEIKIKEGIAQRRQTKLAAQSAEALKPYQEQRAVLTKRLTTFIKDHQGVIPKGKKSVRLTHGELGVRKQQGRLSPIAPNKKAREKLVADAVARLQEENPELVKTDPKIDIKALRKAGEKVYKPLGYGIVGAKDEPWARPDETTVEDLAGKLKPEQTGKNPKKEV